MEPEPQIVFGPFRFDRTTQRLWQGSREIRLRARALAVLRYLLEHPGRVIARQEFAQHVWVGTHVTQSVLRVCIWELRQALGDTGATPHYEVVREQIAAMQATEFQRDSIVSLRHAAQATPSPADDALVQRLAAIETQKIQLEAALAQHQRVLQGQQQRLRELESIRREFKRQHFDDVHATFVDGALLTMLLDQFMGGLLNGENLWRGMQRQYQPRRLHANPLFGSDGFGRPDRVRRSGEIGGEFGGGRFRTGGTF